MWEFKPEILEEDPVTYYIFVLFNNLNRTVNPGAPTEL